MTLPYPVQVGIPPTPCYVRSDEPEILAAFLRFIVDMTDETMALVLNTVAKFNPEWVTPMKQLLQGCTSLVGVPS